ncbi:MAG: 6-phosphogluconate dehydrogenase [Rhodospirillaceae bacterium]|nr:6-phosphogluconate dehydrogenase [Rhodospirillaceae bacterium]|tara:strand:- start:2365 stop:3246 length:882 start_codon:yes stop_codon:yes gene_type:complete
MRVGFIGIGRMGHGMAKRILDAGHELTIYDTNPKALEELSSNGAIAATSIAETVENREVTITMLPTDEALEELTFSKNGLIDCLPKEAIHMTSGTHSVQTIKKLTEAHKNADQILVAGHVLGRPDLAAEGTLTIVPGGPPSALKILTPIFDLLAKQTFIAGNEPQAATAVKIANNFVLGSAIEVIGESMALVRKFGVDPQLFQTILTEGLFGAPAYKIYGQIIVDESYDNVGASVQIGLKDANLALTAGEAVNVPLPCANVWRDRLLSAKAHGEEELDWAVMAREQARASGIE